MTAEVFMKTGTRKVIENKMVKMSSDHEGVFELKLYLRTELGKLLLIIYIDTFQSKC